MKNCQVDNNDMHYLSKYCRAHEHSLVDSRDNGSVDVGDVIFFCKQIDRSVSARGIENHEISCIPLVAVGGVVAETTGDIVMLNQCALHGKGNCAFVWTNRSIKNTVDDESIKVGGQHHAATLDKRK